MKLHRLFAISLAAASLLLGAHVPAWAGLTSIAQVPLLNITGTGTVKPNLMLLFDNSGSMDWHYLPDSVGTGSTFQCRSRAALRDSTNTLCTPGQPPFMTADFNKVYYNPNTRYQAPIKWDGSYYPDMTAANSSNWTAVPMDGFGSRAIDMSGNIKSSATATTNLVSGFPDIKWCDTSGGSNCRINTSSYTYPDATFIYPTAITTNPYYYNIGVAQYCSDTNMTDCVSTSVGAAAPDGYPNPVKVRWCDSTNLSNCQAKQVGNFKYPAFSKPTGAVVSFGTISIGQSATASSLQVINVKTSEPSTQSTITSGSIAVIASTGTNSAVKQQTVASQLAAAINAKTGLTNQYWACVRTPVGTTSVSACSDYGINLPADNIVALIPLDCASTANKTATNCSAVTDASSSGWGIAVATNSVQTSAAVSAVPATALLNVSGTSANSNSTSMASLSWMGRTLATTISLGKSKAAATAITNIVNEVNANTGSTGVTAYAAPNSVTSACSKASSAVCLVTSAAAGNGATPTYGTITGGGTLSFGPVAGTGYVAGSPAVNDSIPITVQAIGPGSAAASTFVRHDIVSTNSSYPKSSERSDCAGATCTYAEEMTNFANWYAYYKTRIQMTKTAVGLAFAPVTGNFRVGLSKMSVSGAGSNNVDVKPADFTGTSRQSWYSTFYGTTTSGSTPTRPALDNIGRMFANQSPYNYSSGNEVVQFPCQQNFILLTTDGYWNQGYTGAATSNDEGESTARFCTSAKGCVDSRSQAAASLADVALYWYNGGSNTGTVSLRPSIDDMSKPGLVPAGAGENTHLHVTTFTLGLGIDGVMNYEENYDTAPVVGGDFYNLITRAASGCPWNNGGAYVWPDPQVGSPNTTTVQERVDDLWHAAINGHGKYFSANDPRAVQSGLSEAIASIQVRVGAASAAATSTPNISQQDNDIFSDIFTTGRWYGELSDKKINIVTGIVGTDATWTTTSILGTTVADSTDTRTIKMLDTATSTLKDFKYSAMSVLEKAWFDNKCSLMPQCALLSTADKAIVNSGANVVDWLRGQQQYADDNRFRAYSMTTPASGSAIPIVLGDIASSKPAFMRGPQKSYSTAGYSQFKSDNASRSATVFTAANDGMLHAFSAASGNELWAYVPRIIMQKLYKQSATNYSSNHQFSTDGSPEISDVQIGGVWKSVLVAGLNGGGRGYYALDVTDPANPVALWELCADAAICAKNDPDIGLTFGNPQFGYWQGKWVVFLTSGYNNVSGVDGVSVGTTGRGFLYIVDIADGTVLKKVDTGNGSTGTPSGLAKITSISSNPFTDPVTTYVYGGDNTGQLFRFDLTSSTAGVVSVVKMGDAGSGQPITTRPEVTQCLVNDVINGVTVPRAQRMVLVGTGRLLDIGDTTDNTTQSMYAVKDSGSAIANIRGASMVQQALSLVGSSTNTNTYGVTNRQVNLSTKDGWYIDLNVNAGERVNLDPQVVSGGVNVVTTMPTSSSSCSVGGSSNVYQFNVCTGASVTAGTPTLPGAADVITVAGNTLSTTSAAVGFIIVRLPSGSIKMITTTASGNTITTNVTPPTSLSARKVGYRSVNGE
jgi:type IV pilus assembly protein PilY1